MSALIIHIDSRGIDYTTCDRTVETALCYPKLAIEQIKEHASVPGTSHKIVNPQNI